MCSYFRNFYSFNRLYISSDYGLVMACYYWYGFLYSGITSAIPALTLDGFHVPVFFLLLGDGEFDRITYA